MFPSHEVRAIQRAADLGVQSVILETDASMVAQAVKSVDYDRCSAGGLIWELKDLLASNFVSYAVNHIPRSCNVVADSLAALARGKFESGCCSGHGQHSKLYSCPRCQRFGVSL